MPFVATGCGLCRSEQRAAIDAAILNRGEKSWRTLATELGLPRPTVQRHAPHAVAVPVVEPPAPVAPPSEPAPLKPRKGHPCETCRSPHRAAIEAAVFELAPVKAIEARFPDGPSDNSIQRHITKCLRDRLEASGPDVREELVRGARDEARGLLAKARNLLNAAETDGSYADRARTITAAKGIVELLGRITGELGADVEVRIVESPRWVELRDRILDALVPFPDALAAVVAALPPPPPRLA
jgi:hypothetical protein